jgi:hypothetical protein
MVGYVPASLAVAVRMFTHFIYFIIIFNIDLCDRHCGLVVSVEDYKFRGPGFDSRALLRIFLRELGLERGPLSLVIG